MVISHINCTHHITITYLHRSSCNKEITHKPNGGSPCSNVKSCLTITVLSIQQLNMIPNLLLPFSNILRLSTSGLILLQNSAHGSSVEPNSVTIVTVNATSFIF
eukprot:Gb_07414 [translate_table: standard]